MTQLWNPSDSEKEGVLPEVRAEFARCCARMPHPVRNRTANHKDVRTFVGSIDFPLEEQEQYGFSSKSFAEALQATFAAAQESVLRAHQDHIASLSAALEKIQEDTCDEDSTAAAIFAPSLKDVQLSCEANPSPASALSGTSYEGHASVASALSAKDAKGAQLSSEPHSEPPSPTARQQGELGQLIPPAHLCLHFNPVGDHQDPGSLLHYHASSLGALSAGMATQFRPENARSGSDGSLGVPAAGTVPRPRASCKQRTLGDLQEILDAEQKTSSGLRPTGEDVILQTFGKNQGKRKIHEVMEHTCASEEAAAPKTGYELFLDTDTRLAMLDTVSALAVILNAMCMGITLDHSPEWPGWLALDICFAVIFVAEILIKCAILGWQDYLMGADRLWNVFEVLLTASAIVEIVLTILPKQDGSVYWSVFRVARLVRITRIFRVCRLDIFTELQVMIKGTLGGTKTLLWSSALIAVPLYVVSLILRETLGDVNDPSTQEFAKVHTAFFTVFRCMVGGDCSDINGRPLVLQLARDHGWAYAVVYCVVTIFMVFGLFNVIIALFVENVVTASKTDDRMKRRERLRDRTFFAEKMTELIAILLHLQDEASANDRFSMRKSAVGTGTNSYEAIVRASKIEITPGLFERLRQDDMAQEIFEDLDIADEDRFSLFETLDADNSGTIDLAELIDGIAKLRGEARRSDIISLDFMLQRISQQVKDSLELILFRLSTLDTETRPPAPALCRR